MSNEQNITGRGESAPAKSELESFLAEVRELAADSGGGRGRIIFALDATQSRHETWDMAMGLQAEMFREVANAGGLEVQLLYYRGISECRASKWTTDTRHLTTDEWHRMQVWPHPDRQSPRPCSDGNQADAGWGADLYWRCA